MGRDERSMWEAALSAGLLALTACAESVEAKDAAAGKERAANEARLEFVDVAAEAGLDVVQVSGDPRRWYIVESNGAGAAWLDYDQDGDSDLFIGNGQGLTYVDDGAKLEIERKATSRLYRNDTPRGGRPRFVDVSAATGTARSDWVNAVATGDVEGDGDLDLYLACFGPDVLLVNQGGTFVDATVGAGLGSDLWAAGAAFGDADNDGDLDLYVANYCLFDLNAPPAGGKRNVIDGVEVGYGPEAENKQGYNRAAPDLFYVNDGRGRFSDRTAEAGFGAVPAGCSYAAIFADVDGDGWQDVLVGNDMQPCNLFVNRGNGTFADEAQARGFAFNGEGKATAAMGLAAADVDGDGDLDVLRTNFDFEANALHENDGRGHFKDVAGTRGLAAPSEDKLGWGAVWFDAELDGDLDLAIANGHVCPQAEQIGMHAWAQRSQLFENRPTERGPHWIDRPERAGSGFALLRSARGMAAADYDRDGDLDLLLVDLDERPRLLENRSARQGHWLAVELVGTQSNRFGFGARIVVSAGGRRWSTVMATVSGLYSSHEPRAHFGLGALEALDTLEVFWPSGRVSRLERPELDTLHSLTEPQELAR